MITHGPGRQGPGGARNARTGVNLLGVPPGRFLLLCGATLALSLPLLAAAGGPPACTYEDWPATHVAYDDYPFTVLDTVFALPADYEPPDLVSASLAFPPSYDGGGGLQVRAVILEDLRAMLAAAEAASIRLAVQSAYRSFAYQERTFDYWVDRDGLDAALASSARPGHSEHQLGTALDLRSWDGPPAWDLADWADTKEGAWVAANAYRFGFVMSYPEGSKDVTCYVYEPWHYRYVGRELAAAIHESGLTPREYLWLRPEVAAAPRPGGAADGAEDPR